MKIECHRGRNLLEQKYFTGSVLLLPTPTTDVWHVGEQRPLSLPQCWGNVGGQPGIDEQQHYTMKTNFEAFSAMTHVIKDNTNPVASNMKNKINLIYITRYFNAVNACLFYIFGAYWTCGYDVAFWIQRSRFEPWLHQYAVPVSKALDPHCFSRLSC